MYCEVCGVPLGITRGNMWHADGSITGRFPPHIKGTFFDVDELGFLFRSLSEFMDYDIGPIIASGKYHDSREYMAALVGKMKEASGGKLPADEELYRMMLYPICIWGIGDVEIASVQPGEMVIRVKEPYSIPLLCGDVAGVADVVTGREHTATWEGDEREGVIKVIPAEGFARVSGLIDEGSSYGVKNEARELECERCGECGAPMEVSKLFGWGRDRCRIQEKLSGRRYCFNNTRGIAAVLGMLVKELGEDIEQRMVETARDYSRSLYERIAGRPEGNGRRGGIDLQAHLDGFSYRGWGRITGISRREDEWVVSVESPYSGILLSGRIWGMIEASSGLDLRISDREEEAKKLLLELKPR